MAISTTERHVPVRFLNSIEKRKLSVALSLCGKPTLVVLDEPMIGLDSEARFQLWQFIAKEKKGGKAVIITDPYLEEAEVFADRILILQNGMVECWGPPKYINEKYLSGYRLILGIENAESIETIQETLREFVPTAKMIAEKEDEVQFLLGMDTSKFCDMLRKIEEDGEELGIISFTLSYICLELLVIRSLSPETSTISEISVHHQTVERRSANSKRVIMRNCLKALIMKRLLCTFKTYYLTILEILIPLAIFWFAFEVDITRDLEDLPIKKLSLETCGRNAIIIINGDNAQMKYHKNIKAYVNGKAKVEFVNNKSVESLVLDMHHPYLKVWYVFGADITQNRIVASFNGDLYHSAPIALNFAMNYVLKKSHPSHLIEIHNFPLPPVRRTKEYFNKTNEIGHLLAMLTSIWMSLVFAFLMAFYVKPLQSQKEYLRIMSGASANMLFGIHIVFNFFVYLAFAVFLVVLVAACWHHHYSSRYILCLGCIFLIYGIHMFPLLYLLSFWTNSETAAFIVTLSVCSLTGFFLYIVEELIERAFLVPVLVYNTPLSLLPNYNLCTSVQASSVEFWKHRSCSKFVITCMNVYLKSKKECERLLCLDFSKCCHSKDKYFSLEDNTVLVNVICAIATSIVLTAILFFIEHNTFRNIANLFKKRKVYNDRTTSCIFDIVESPMRNPMNALPRLTAQEVCYKIGDVVIVKNISFEVFPGECLGLVGTDDLGRAAILKIIVGQAAPSEGTVIINDLAFDENTSHSLMMGYCPSDPCFVKALTMRNNLRLACIIKGIPDFRKVIANLAHDLDFEKSLDIKVKNLSHLDVQKLNLAIALIEEPDLLILDELTLSLDLKPKLQIWRLLKQKISKGMSVILTTSSMEECDVLCDKITLIVNGRIRSKGGMMHLRDTYSQGHILIVTIPKNISTNDLHFKTDIEDRISSIFRYSKLIHTYDRNIVHLIATTLSWTSVLEELERVKEEFGLDTYRICPSSFDLVYILLTRQQTLQVRM